MQESYTTLVSKLCAVTTKNMFQWISAYL